MAKVKWNVSGSDPERAVFREQPTPGIYSAKVQSCKPGFKKDENTGKPNREAPRLEVVYEVTQRGKFRGFRLYEYISFSEAAQWKLDQFLQALGIANTKKRQGTFDTDDVVGEPCRIRVVGDTYNNEYRARAGAVFAPSDEDDEGEDLDEDEEEDIEEDEEDEEVEEEEDEEEEEEEEEEVAEDEYYTRDYLEGLDARELAKVLKEFDITTAPKTKKGKVDAILEAQGADEEEEEEEEEAEDEYDEMSDADLRKEAKGRGIATVGGRVKIIQRLRDSDAEDPFAS